ncbi:MAG: hypothetical protein BJBARM4_0614 [Candidatus Parvarchaeum acidiphilum ARMAN-4]|uniref:Uncharacterized protein n=1 Tax=Candidatus Parvarchaeum acidiphilum ARMAN-4 TaxID=662760 RepID=D2EFT9_PARA4|nr:MAG: hypothetical protein BJBARM4_0614 [Candidatus Parvarchaeum acidiphilum ARMAN-4]
MAEDDKLKRIEQEASKEERKIEQEIKKEEAQVKKDETELKKEEGKINLLKKESEKLEQVKEEVSNKKISEVEIELNLSGFKTFVNTAYYILIKKRVLFYILLILAVTVGFGSFIPGGWYIHTASIPALLNPLQSNSPLIGNNYLGMGGSLSGLDPYTFYIQMQNVLKTGNVPAINHLEYLPIG